MILSLCWKIRSYCAPSMPLLFHNLTLLTYHCIFYLSRKKCRQSSPYIKITAYTRKPELRDSDGISDIRIPQKSHYLIFDIPDLFNFFFSAPSCFRDIFEADTFGILEIPLKALLPILGTFLPLNVMRFSFLQP